MEARGALLLLLCYVLAVISTTSAGQCQKGCISSKVGKYNYVPDSMYTYSIDSTISFYLTGNDAQETSLKVQGQVQLFVEQNCGYVLRIQRINVISPDGTKTALGPEFTKPVRFTLSNDELSPQICAESNDNEYSLNLKRAIISIIQSAEERGQETDVFGTCPTTFNTNTVAGTTIVSKVRNLNLCSNRETLASGFITGVVNEHSGVTSTPLLNGDFSSEQRIKDGILESAIVNEEYNFVPLTAGEAGARAKVITTIKLTSAGAGPSPKIVSPTDESILFSNPSQNSFSNLNNARGALKNVLSTYEVRVGATAAKQFTELIRIFRVTNRSDLLALYQQVKSGAVSDRKILTRQIFFDALFRTGTGESVEVLAQFVKSRELNEQELKLVYLSLNLVTKMTKEALNSVNKLLDGNPPKEAYLTVGNLVSKYCKKNSCSATEIKSITEKFVSKIVNCKDENRNQADTLVAVLKGLRNTNNLVGNGVDRVTACTSDKSSTRVRVAAIQALSAADNNPAVEQTLLAFLNNRDQDSEIRIEAYLALAAHPTENFANHVATLLADEPVYQVGSFLVTHIQSSRSSVDPSKAKLRKLFQNIKLEKKYPRDPRKYSFNNEFSYAIDSLGFGGIFDTNVIYSQKSYLPRSASFNFTGDVFGQSFNVFEIAGRQENLEQIVENYFGPKGYFNSKSSQEIYDSISSALRQHGRPGRQRRGLKEDVQKFGSTVDLGRDLLRGIDIDLSFKLFGTEMFFLSLGKHAHTTPEKFLDDFIQVVGDSLEGAQNIQKVFENQALFLDGDLTYPTSIGFPLKLVAQGSSVVRIELLTSYNEYLNAKSNEKSLFKIRVQPSASIYATGSLSLDAFIVNAGLQVSGAVHTSTGVDLLLFNTDGGNGLKLNVKFPFSKQEIISIDHKVVFIQQNKGQETKETSLKFSSQKKELTGCFDQLQPFTGLVLCTEISATIPGVVGVAPFPLNGENKFSVSLQVDDEYSFAALYKPEDKLEKIILSYERPNAQQPNKVEFSLELSYGHAYYVRAGLDFPPYGKNIVEAGVLHANNEFSLYVKSSDSREEQIAKIGFLISGDRARQELRPNVYIKTRNGEYDNIFGYKVDGKVIIETNQDMKFTFEQIQIIGGEQQPLKIDGYVEWLKNIVNTDLKFSRASKSGSVISHLEFSGNPALLNFDVALTTNFDDLLNGKVILNILSDNTERKFNFEVIYGKDFNSQTNRASYKSLVKINPANSVPEFNEVSLYIGFLPAEAHYKYELPSPHHFVGEAGAGYGKTKLSGTFDLEVSPNKLHAYNLAASGTYNEYTAKLNSKYDVGNRNKFENKLSFSTGLSTEVNFSFKPSISENELDFDVEGVLVLDPKQDQYRVFLSYAGQPKATVSTGKFTIGKTDFTTYDYKFNRLPNQDVLKIDFFVREVLTGKSEIKSVNGKGDGFVLVNLVKAQRKLKSDIKFNLALPIADATVDFYYDFEKDNTKKLTYTTKNKLNRNSVDSKNTVECSSQGKYVLNFDFAQKGELNDGTIGGKFTFILPDLHTYTGELNRAVNFVKREQITGNIDVKLEERYPNKKTRTLKFNGKVNEGNLNKGLIDITHSIAYNNLDSKTLIIENAVRKAPNPNMAYAFKTTLVVKGSLVPETIGVTIDLTEVDKTNAAGLISVAYGKAVTAGIQGSYHIGDRAVPLTYEFDSYLNVPSGNVKSSTLNSKGSILVPATDSQPYVINFEANSKIDRSKISFKTNLQLGTKSGVVTFDLSVPEASPVTGSYKYQRDETDDYTKCFSEYFVKYDNGKMLKGDFSVGRTSSNDDVTITGNVDTPFTDISNLHFDVSTKSANNEKYTFLSKFKINNDKVYIFKLDQNYNPSNSKFDLDVTTPNDNYRVYYGYKQLADHKYRSEAKIVNVLAFNFDGDFEINYSTLDEFYIKANVDSPQLKLNKIAFETYTKPSSSGKGIIFKVTSQGENVVNGAADFVLKDDKFKMVVEGTGTIKLYDRQSQVKFDFVRRFYDIQRDGEQGFSVQFTSIIGERNSKNGFTSHFKLTDKELIVKDKYCDGNNECIVFDLASHIDRKDLNNLRHDLTAFIDLKALGLNQAIQIKSETKNTGTAIDHVTDVTLTTANFEYQYNMYAHPKKAGVILTIPTRVVSIESNYDYPEDTVFGKYDFSVTAYTDKKNKPNHKYYLGYEGTLQSGQNYQISGKDELRIIYPSLKPLIIRESYTIDFTKHNYEYNGDYDIFQDEANKITVTGNIRNNYESIATGFNITSTFNAYSRGLELDYRSTDFIAIDFNRKLFHLSYDLQSSPDNILITGYITVNEHSLEVYNNYLNFEKYSLNAKYDAAKLALTVNSNLEYKGYPYKYVGYLKINGPQAIEFEIKHSSLYSYKVLWFLNKEASFQFYDLTDNQQKELIVVKVLLGNKNFLTSTYNYNEEGINGLAKRIVELERPEAEQLSNSLEELIKRITNLLVKKYYAKIENAIYSYAKVNEDFNNEIELIKEEILSDKVLNELYQRILKLIKVYGQVVQEFITIFGNFYETINEQILKATGSIIEVYSKQIKPALEAYISQIAKVVYDIYKESAKLIGEYIKEAFDILKTYESDLNKIGKVGIDFYRNVAQTIAQYTEIIRKELTGLYELVLKYIQSYPTIEACVQTVLELVEEYKLKEYAITISDTIFSILIESVPTSEAKKFFDNLKIYVEAKINANGQQLPNETEILKSLYTDLLHTIRAIVAAITGKTTSYVNEYGVFDNKYGSVYQPIPLSYDYFKNLPIFSGGIRSSLFNYITNNEQLLSVRDVLNVVRPRGLKSGDILPPYDMYGLIADGQHIFTFDGQHLTFPGKCQYILAQDFANNNFSIVGTYNKGGLKSITLIDKTDQVELQDSGVVLLNGNKADLPIFTDDISVLRNYYSTTVNTKYGAEITCSTDLRVCHVTVSGFYLGKVRGLLGNGNGEPYDDFKLPNNKISTNYVDFGNAYKLKAGCESVSFVDHSAHVGHHQTETICDEFFGTNSPLRLCNYFIEKSNYYEACQHAIATSANKEDAACNIALAYGTLCAEDKIPISIPSKCAKCINNVEVGDHFSVKVSQKQADIVLVVDTENGTTITDFIQPFIQDLRKEFKARDVSDIKITVIGYNKHKVHINLFTDKGKLDFNGKLQNYKFNGPSLQQPIHTTDNQFNNLLNEIYNADLEILDELGLSADTRAFQLAYKYPFRSTAMKSIIAIRNDELETINIFKIISAVVTQGDVTDNGISLHLVAPIKGVTNSKDAKKSKDIIGFNNKVAIQINEAKKRTNYGSADIRKNLKYDQTLGTELVTESGGFVFSLTAFDELKPQPKKNFISIASGSIADQLTRFEIQNDCVCHLRDGLHPVELCEVVSKKVLPAKKSTGRG